MKLNWFATLSCCALLLGQSLAVPESTRQALVIGNQRYSGADALDCAANDAKAIAAMLKRCDFEVMEHHDLNQQQMQDAITSFADGLTEGGIAFIYYSGHGFQSGKKNFLMPVDATSTKNVTEKCITLDDLFEPLQQAQTAVNIILLDCCRSATAPPKSAPGFADTKAPSNTVLGFATAYGKFALDGVAPGPGPYASAVARHLAQPEVEIVQALRMAGADVKKETNGEQQPWIELDFNEQFYLKPAAGSAGKTGKFQAGEDAAQALTFARRFLEADGSNDAGVVLQFYAPNVDNYFGREEVTGAEIVQDRRKGIANAPERRYHVEHGPVVSRSDADGSHTILCERRCEFKSAGKTKLESRPSHLAFKVRPRGKSWEIFYIAAHQPKKDAVATKRTAATFETTALEQFLIGFDSADEEKDPTVGMQFFAPNVQRYFKLETPTHQAILDDRAKHRKRWPIRRYLPQTYRVIEVKEGKLVVEYSTDYEHMNGKDKTTGSAKNQLTLQIVDPKTFLITEISSAKGAP